MKTMLVARAVTSVLLVSTLFAQNTPVLPILKIPETVSRSLCVHYVAPVLPPKAMRECVEGIVVLELIVGETGAVLHTTVLSGPTKLAEAATGAAKKWMYEPYILDGKPVRYKTQATEKFQIPHEGCPSRDGNTK